MKRTLIISVLAFFLPFLLSGQKNSDPSYRYYASPGLVNITEIHYGKGVIINDLDIMNPNSYVGITNVIGYQANRNFFSGLGFGYLQYDIGRLIPMFLEYRYSVYLNGITPYFYAQGGWLLSLSDFRRETKIFINPGIGLSRTISPRMELNLSAGLNVQSRSTITSVGFMNFKVGVIYRKDPFRMLKAKNNNYY